MAPKKAFTQAKQQALTKYDKSSATSFDARVVGLCAAANDSPYVFTTSSCSGRHLLWRGEGVKATQSFARGRGSHDRADAAYFLDHDANEQAPFRKAPLDAPVARAWTRMALLGLRPWPASLIDRFGVCSVDGCASPAWRGGGSRSVVPVVCTMA